MSIKITPTVWDNDKGIDQLKRRLQSEARPVLQRGARSRPTPTTRWTRSWPAKGPEVGLKAASSTPAARCRRLLFRPRELMAGRSAASSHSRRRQALRSGAGAAFGGPRRAAPARSMR